jgi:hypothetical protein
VAKAIVKILLLCGFRRTAKAIGQVYQCCWRICREINVFFSRFEYHMFYVLYPFTTYLLTLPCILLCGDMSLKANVHCDENLLWLANSAFRHCPRNESKNLTES